jgi:hypothetical protein
MPTEDQPQKIDNDWYVECWNCGARGPYCGSLSDYDDYFSKIVVVKAWNKEQYDFQDECKKFMEMKDTD